MRGEFDAALDMQGSRGFSPYGEVFGAQGTFASPYAFTGEPLDANGLVHLRARYYHPGIGRFMSMDPSWQEANPYWYSSGNPVTFIDPSGLRRMPSETAWVAAGGWASRYSKRTLRFVWQNRDTIVAAAKRHNLISRTLSTSFDWEETAPVYALAAILYNERWGQLNVDRYTVLGTIGYPTQDVDEVIPDNAGLTLLLTVMYLTSNCRVTPNSLLGLGSIIGIDAMIGTDVTLGPAQISSVTVKELEDEGLLCSPGYGNNPTECYTWNGASFNSDAMRDINLLSPTFAIEYAAANMELATIQDDFDKPNKQLTEYIPDWNKQAGWHNKGIVDPGNPYFPWDYIELTFASMEGIKYCDLLGLEGRNSCISRP
jgi:RHS repeat-associated protein